MDCSPKIKITPSLSFDGMVGAIRQVAHTFRDSRTGNNTQYTMESDQGNNNARTLFGINKIPTDNQIRLILDQTSPEALFPVFNKLFEGFQEARLLEGFSGALSRFTNSI